jgi:hypothetical protein
VVSGGENRAGGRCLLSPSWAWWGLGAPYAYVLPRSSETAAAIRQAAMANPKAAARPWPKAGLMTEGKKERPVS